MTLGDALHLLSVRLTSISPQWILTPFNASDSTWEISSMSDRVSIDVQDSPIPGARVVASPDPAIWQIREVEGDPDHFQYVQAQPTRDSLHPLTIDHSISFLDTPLNISLADDGSSENDTPVELAIHSSDASQMWKFQPV